MKQVDYNFPIFVYSVGIAGLSKDKSEERMSIAKSTYENMNVNMWFVYNKHTELDDIKCVWQPSLGTAYEKEKYSEYEF